MKQVIRLALGGIAVGVLVLALKYAAYRVTGSVALYSDAAESIINVATAVAAFFAVRLSAVPPDANHPYGHHKVEYLSAVMEGVLIVVAALAILRKAYLGYFDPQPIGAPALGLAINGLATVINAVWCFMLFRVGRRRRSPALLADAHHLFTDVITSLGVLVGVALVAFTGWLVLDCDHRRSRRAAHPVVGMGADAAIDRRADGRGGVQRRAGEDPPGDLQGGGRRARGA